MPISEIHINRKITQQTNPDSSESIEIQITSKLSKSDNPILIIKDTDNIAKNWLKSAFTNKSTYTSLKLNPKIYESLPTQHIYYDKISSNHFYTTRLNRALNDPFNIEQLNDNIYNISSHSQQWSQILYIESENNSAIVNCTCKDYEHRHNEIYACKHILVIKFLLDTLKRTNKIPKNISLDDLRN